MKSETKYVKAIGQIVQLIPRINNGRGCFESSFNADQPSVRKEFYSFLAAEKHEFANKFTPKCSFENPCGDCARCFYEACRDKAIAQGLVVKIAFKGRGYNKQGKPKRGSVKFYTPEEAATFQTAGNRSYAPTKLTDLIRAGL